jgi:hypothetical protein
MMMMYGLIQDKIDKYLGCGPSSVQSSVVVELKQNSKLLD